VPDIAKDFLRRGLEQIRKFAIVLPSPADRLFINRTFGRAKVRTCGRDIGLRVIQAHVALALLLRIIKRMRVQERPDELTADIFEPEFKVRVLIDRVVAAKIRAGSNHDPLLIRNFFGTDQSCRIASSRCGDRRIEGVRERVAKRYARRAGLDLEFQRRGRLVLVRSHLQLHCTPEISTVTRKNKKSPGKSPGLIFAALNRKALLFLGSGSRFF
jgi:hypothetical protein